MLRSLWLAIGTDGRVAAEETSELGVYRRRGTTAVLVR